jgi:O-methyltransferase involved in polyketide biosynthesis
MTDGPADAPPGVDLSRPNAARIYDALLGGAHNWAIDRRFAEQAVETLPMVKTVAWANREFLGRAVRYCARQGVTQFLDLGSGVPTVGNVHEVANEVSDQTRCVYVDIEPVAAAHCRLLLEKYGDPKRHATVQADMVDVESVWQQALDTGVLDPQQPIAVLMVAILHFVSPDRGAHAVVQRYRELLVPGSRLIISHGTRDGMPEDLRPQADKMEAQYKTSSTPVYSRTPAEITDFFGDFVLEEPGLVWLPQWRPDEHESQATAEFADAPERCGILGGVGRKPTE